MPGHNGPPDVTQSLDVEAEQIKRPKRRGAGTRRPASRQRVRPPEISPPESSTATSGTPQPEPLVPPVPPVPPLSLKASNTYSPSNSPSSVPISSDGPAQTANSSASPLSPSNDVTLSPAPIPSTASTYPKPNNPPKPGAESSPTGGVITVGGIDFHHASEAEFARLLDYYGIEWLYEPNQFPLQWRDGRPVEMFSPDFYLVEYDMYIELTTMRQSLVRRKNRKLRLLRALYPEINIKLLYRRDYQRLLERFGIKPEEIEAETASPAEQIGVEE